MGTESSLPSPAPFGSPSTSALHTTLSIDGFADVNNMKIDNPHVSSVIPAVVVHTPHPRNPSLQADVATLIDDKSTLQTHAYSRVWVIKLGTYSRSLLRSTPRPKGQKLGCAVCTAFYSLGIDHCHKQNGYKNGKGPQKRLRR